MANDPAGKLVTPIGFDPTGNLRPLEMTVEGYLRAYLENNIVSIPHVLLDGSIHTDTVADAPVRGDIIRGNSTPKWARLAKGSANQVVSTDGTDVLYQALATLIKNAILTANGDILIRDAAGNVVPLLIGTAGQILTVSAALIPGWESLSDRHTLGFEFPIAAELNMNPADATTYYFGMDYGASFASSYITNFIVFHKVGLITNVYIRFAVTTGGTAESVSVYVRVNNSTDTLLTNSMSWAASAVINISGLAIEIAANDFINIKIVTPTWVTNPLNVRAFGTVFVTLP